MATYTGALNESSASKRTDGTVTEPSATLNGVARVVLCDPYGNPVAAVTPPGSTPDAPLWVGSADGANFRARLEGGVLDRIAGPVAVNGAVSTELATLAPTIVAHAAAAGASQTTLAAILAWMMKVAGDVVTPEVPNLVIVDGTVTTRPERAIAAMETAVTVSTSAVRLVGANAARKALVITNNSSGTLYVGYTSSVTSSGTGMGRAVAASGSYSDFGEGVYIGDVWGIYSASASSPNVAVCEAAA